MQRAQDEEERAYMNRYNKEQSRKAISDGMVMNYTKNTQGALRLKEESQKNQMMIRRQKEHEVLKNNGVKEMIRK